MMSDKLPLAENIEDNERKISESDDRGPAVQTQDQTHTDKPTLIGRLKFTLEYDFSHATVQLFQFLQLP